MASKLRDNAKKYAERGQFPARTKGYYKTKYRLTCADGTVPFEGISTPATIKKYCQRWPVIKVEVVKVVPDFTGNRIKLVQNGDWEDVTRKFI